MTSSSSPTAARRRSTRSRRAACRGTGCARCVVCGSHFSHSSSCAHAGSVSATVTSSLGEWRPNSCTLRPRRASAASRRGPATPIAPDALQRLDDGYAVDQAVASRSRSTRSTYSGRASGISARLIVVRDCAIGRCRAARARKFQCSGRRVQSMGPSRMASSKTTATGATSAFGPPAREVARGRASPRAPRTALEDLGLLAQTLADLGLLRDEVAEQHQRRQRDDQQGAGCREIAKMLSPRMIGATSIGQGNSRGMGSFGMRGSGSASPTYLGSTRGLRLNSRTRRARGPGSASTGAKSSTIRMTTSVSPS